VKDPRKRYGKCPASVLTDTKLSDRAARLYGIIAMHAFEGATATIGVRRLSQILPSTSKSEISRRISELRERGHIDIQKGANGQRSIYVLLSPVFGQRQEKSTIVRSGPSGLPRMVSVAKEDVA
jgi:hypothetical protein